MNTTLIALLIPVIGIIFLLFVTILIWYIVTMNNLRTAEVKIDEALSGIDVALAKRYDVLIKLLDISKSYASYERATILETIRLRSGMSMEERNQITKEMDGANHFINMVAENYPQLKSSDNFRQLQMAVMDVEEHLQAARRLYNSNISYLNQRIISFPSSIVASNLGLQQRAFFVADEFKRQDVNMQFTL